MSTTDSPATDTNTVQLASIRIIAEDLEPLVRFYETLTGAAAQWLTDDFVELVTPSATVAISRLDTRASAGALSAGLLCHLASEPSRVLTKVNFELRRPRKVRERGFRGLAAGWSPFPGVVLWSPDYRAVSRGGRRPLGYGKVLANSAPGDTRAEASSCERQPPDVVSSITAMSDASPERRALDQTNFTARCRGCHHSSGRRPPVHRKTTGPLPPF